MTELSVGMIITSAFEKGLKNLVPLLVNVILWILTIWIPYLNVGTTIGLFFGITAKMARDETIEMTEIFNPEYRKRMGEFFLTFGLVMMGVYAGLIFFIIPGYVIMIAWSLAILLVIDKGESPMQAITKSNDYTYGKKWTIFFGLMVVSLAAFIALFIIMFILGKIFGMLGGFGSFLLILCGIAGYSAVISIVMAAQAVIYGTLVK